MNDLVKLVKVLQRIERSISEEEGMFSLFALFVLEETPGRLDLLVAAPWIDKDAGAARGRIAKDLQKKLTMQQLRDLSNLIIFDNDNRGLVQLQRAVHAEHGDIEHGYIELRDRNFFGLDVKIARIITCRRTEVARKAGRARRTVSAKRGRDSRKRRVAA